jgi:hypothetical protein
MARNLEEAARIRKEMASRKVCSCGATCCLACGNEAGKKYATGAAHCPRCGKRLS